MLLSCSTFLVIPRFSKSSFKEKPWKINKRHPFKAHRLNKRFVNSTQTPADYSQNSKPHWGKHCRKELWDPRKQHSMWDRSQEKEKPYFTLCSNQWDAARSTVFERAKQKSENNFNKSQRFLRRAHSITWLQQQNHAQHCSFTRTKTHTRELGEGREKDSTQKNNQAVT